MYQQEFFWEKKMAIKTDDSSISVNFVYHDDELNEDFTIKLHCVEGIGKAISINGDTRTIDDNGVEYLSFPAQLFVEIVDFLRSQGYLKLTGSAAVVSTPLHGTQISAVRASSGGVLPVPIFGQAPVQTTQQEERIVPVASSPFQSLSYSVPMSNEGTMISDDGNEDVEMEPIGNEATSKYKAIAADRKAAAEKVVDVEKKISRPVRIDYGQQIKEKIKQQAEDDYERYEEV